MGGASRPGREGTEMPKVGDVRRWDFQSDPFQGEYRLVTRLTGRRWVAEYAEPSDELIAEIQKFYLESEHPYLGYHDPFGPERREATRQEAFDQEVLERIERAGAQFELEIVSAAEFARHF